MKKDDIIKEIISAILLNIIIVVSLFLHELGEQQLAFVLVSIVMIVVSICFIKYMLVNSSYGCWR